MLDAMVREVFPVTDYITRVEARAELAALRAEISSWRAFAARLAEHLHGWDKSFPAPSEPDEQASYRGSLLARADVVCAQHAQMRHALGRLRHTPECASQYPVGIYDDTPLYPPCTCGLDAALEEIR